MSILCGTDSTCPFLYQCNTASNQCQHLPVFPLTIYPLFIYITFPICSALCNLSGNSFGEYKVLLLMDLLNYSQNAATTLTYPLITGTGLINFFLLIPKRHPTRNTSLVDFNVIMILIPNVLFGSTIGALVNNFIPPIAADVCIIPIYIAFAIKFFLRFKKFRQQENQKEKTNQYQLMQKTYRSNSSKPIHNNQKEQLQKQDPSKSDPSQLKNINQKEISQSNKNKQLFDRIQIDASDSISIVYSKMKDKKKQEIKKLQINPYQNQHDRQLQYESGYHIPHIFATILIFLIFEFLSFIAQGKIPAIAKFSQCSIYYLIGIFSLTVIYIIFIVCMYFYTSYQMKRYRRIQYQYDGNLDVKKQYAILCCAGAFGGFMGGVFGLGSSTTMIFALLYLNIQPSVVSATVGFQVFFSGAASLAQAFVRNQISFQTAGFFFGQTFLLGGALTIVARWRVQRLNIYRVNMILVFIVGCLCSISIIALIANIIVGFIAFGSNYMTSIKYDC